jgi:hypothetical protein
MAQAQRIVEGERMRHAGLIGLGRNNDNVIGDRARNTLEHIQALGMNAIVIGDQNAHCFNFLSFVIASAAKQSSPVLQILDCFVASLLAMTRRRLYAFVIFSSPPI